MEMSYIVQRKKKNRPRNRLIPALVWLIVVSGCLGHAVAQNRNNQSDWNVPPPLTPGTISKGNPAGNNGSAGKPVVLTLTNIPGIPQPVVPGGQVPVLAAIGTTPPVVAAPGQPNINGVGAGLPEIPTPAAPEAPDLPKQTMQDLQLSSVLDLPVPELPELPPPPVEPTVSGKINVIKGPVPVMPDITGAVSLLQPPGNLIPWSTPQIPENVSFKMVTPTGTKEEKAKNRKR